MSDLARILVAPLAWLAAFSAVYGLSGLLCAGVGPSGTVLGWPARRVVLAAAFLAVVLMQGALLRLLYSARYGAPPGFTRTVSRAGGWVGLVASLWTLFPTLTTSACG